MQVLGFSHYNLRAPRDILEELRSFYCDVVGLTAGPRPRFRSNGYWLYAAEQDVLHLTECPADESRSTKARTTFDHVAFNCGGREAYQRRLAKHGVRYDVDAVPQTGQFQIFFRDPGGNGVELNFSGDTM